MSTDIPIRLKEVHMAIHDLDRKNLESFPEWNPNDIGGSLNDLFNRFVFDPLTESISWYFEKRKSKRRLGLWIRLLAIVPAGVGTAIPIMSDLVQVDGTALIPASWAAIALLIAAGMIWTDRFLGGTSGWIRYVTTGLDLSELRDDAVLQWTKTQLTWAHPLSEDQLSEAMSLIQDLNGRAHGLVSSETEKWIAEFRSSLQQIENKIQTRLKQSEEMLAEVRQRQVAPSTGVVQVAVSNADAAGNIEIGLEPGADCDVEPPDVSKGGQAVFLAIKHGLWRVYAVGNIKVDGDQMNAYAQTVVTVTAGQVTKVKLTLE